MSILLLVLDSLHGDMPWERDDGTHDIEAPNPP
jgi:hypothetical protein